MKKFMIGSLLVIFGCANLQQAGFAEEFRWFMRYDHNHDGHWSYHSFKAAHKDYMKRHPEEPAISDEELHNKFRDFSQEHPGWVTSENVRKFHNWD